MNNRFDTNMKHEQIDVGGWPVNFSGVHPKGHAVLGLPYEPPKKGLVILPDNVRERTQMLEDKILVIDHGKACWVDEPEQRCEIGDLVLIPYLAGRMVKGKDGKQYRMVNDKDIIATVDKDEEVTKNV